MNKYKLETGDVILHTDPYGSFIGWLIKRITKGMYTHAAIYVGNGLMAESYTTGVVIHEIWDYGIDEAHYFRYKGGLNDTQKKYILRNINLQLGKKYDFFQNFLNLLKYYLRWSFTFNNASKVNCSEFVARVYEESDLSLDDGTNPFWDLDYVTPGDIANSKKLKEVT